MLQKRKVESRKCFKHSSAHLGLRLQVTHLRLFNQFSHHLSAEYICWLFHGWFLTPCFSTDVVAICFSNKVIVISTTASVFELLT